MLNVPYSPVPDVRPSSQGTPTIGVDAPGAAFGTTVAQAVSSVGGDLSKDGDEIFQRAMALQDLHNAAESDDAVTKYMAGLGDIHAKFNALEGQARVQAYPQYLTDIKTLREQIGSNVSNPMARRMYDRESLSTMGRTMFSGAVLAADGQKQWMIGSANAASDMLMKHMTDNADNDVMFNADIKKLEEKQRFVAQMHGEDDTQANDRVMNALSAAYRERVMAKGWLQPNEAATMLDDYKAKHLITDTDYQKANALVRSSARSIGAANIAHDVYSNNPDMGVEDMVAVVRDKVANSPFAKDAVFERDTVNALRGMWNQRNYEQRIEDNENWQTVNQAILEGVQKGTVHNERDLLLNPQVASAYHNLKPTQQRSVTAVINNTTASLNKVTNQQTATQLRGMLGTQEGVEKFLNTDLTRLPLEYNDLKAFQNEQNRLAKNAQADPRVWHAMQTLRGAMGPQLQSLGIYNRDKSNPDDFDHFAGALSEALTQWRDTHKTQPTADDIVNTIGPQLLRTHAVPGFLYGNNQVPFFKSEVPEDFKKTVTQELTDRGQPPPDDNELYRAYIRDQYTKLYAKQKTQARAPGQQAPGPAVPISQ